MKNTERLKTVTGEELMNEPIRPPNFIVDSLLSQGLHILAGAPKVGKSWLALWLAVTVAKGEPVWGMSVRQGTTLYLCLEDSTLRIQNRLFEITEDAPANVHFCTESRVVGAGLEEQLETFLTEHPDTSLVIIDTLQMVRSAKRDNTYANDYSDLSALKKIADAHSLAILLIHHLRKENADDVFKRISGTTAISGAVDSSFTLVENGRGSGQATLYCIGRDIEYRELSLVRSECNIWDVEETLLPVNKSDNLISLLSAFVKTHGKFIGTPTELVSIIDPAGTQNISTRTLSRKLLQSAGALRKAGIEAIFRRSNGKRIIELVSADSDDTTAPGNIGTIDPVTAHVAAGAELLREVAS